jgi:fibronectin-binding autotransporter adhesin
VDNNGALGSGAVTFNGGELQIEEFSNLSFHNNFYVNKTGGLISLDSGKLTLSGIIADGDGPGLLKLVGLELALVTLSGVNTYSGGTHVIGILQVTNNSAAGIGTITLDLGMGILIAGADNLSVNNDFKLNYYTFVPGRTACGQIASNGFTLTLSGTIADGEGSAGITFGGYPFSAGTTILTGTNSYTGGTLIAHAETLQLGNGGTSGSILGNVKNEEGTLAFNRSDTYAFNGVIADSSTVIGPPQILPGKVAQVGTGTTVLNGVNTYTAGTTISAGALQVTNGSSVGPGTVALNGGTFQAGADNLEFSNAFKINTADGKIDTNGNTLTIGGVIADGNGPGALTKTGAGTLILTGLNTYTGVTTVDAGTLIVNGSIASSSGLRVAQGAFVGGVGTLPTTAIGGAPPLDDKPRSP